MPTVNTSPSVTQWPDLLIFIYRNLSEWLALAVNITIRHYGGCVCVGVREGGSYLESLPQCIA